VKRTFIISPVAKEAEGDIIPPQPTGHQRGPHDTIGSKRARLDVGNLQRAAATVAEARLFAKELGEHSAPLATQCP